MKTDKYTKEEVNQAIFTVLTASYVKDAPDAFKIVKAAGYVYDKYKYNSKSVSRFRVENLDTGNLLEIKRHGHKIGVYRYEKNYHCRDVYFSRDTLSDPIPFDYVGFLDKPTNESEYWGYKDTTHSKSTEQYYRLRCAKEWVKDYEGDIERLNNEMANLQKELLDAKKVLSDLRKEFGLSHS